MAHPEERRFFDWLRDHSPQAGLLYILAKDREGKVTQHWYAGDAEPDIDKLRADYHVWTGLTRYGKRKATKANALPTRLVWIDHDGPNANPYNWDPTPHVVIQTSEGRFQAVWLLGQEIPKKKTEELCAGLARAFGADPSDRDITQVHRVPGTFNLKHDPPYPVKLLWLKSESEQAPYRAEDLRVTIPVTPVTPAETPTLPDGGSREHALYLLGQLQVPEGIVAEGFIEAQKDRSAALYSLVASVLEKGGTLTDAYRIASHSVNQKFDTPERLWEDVVRTAPKIRIMGGQKWTTYHISDLEEVDDEVIWIVSPYLYSDAVGTVVGEPSSRKSWAILQLLVAVACPEATQFWDQPVLIHGPVLYFNLDDRRTRRLKLRLGNILAYYRDGNRALDIPFEWTDSGLNFNVKDWKRWLAEDLDRMEQKYGTPVVLTVVDTMHKAGFDPKDWGVGAQVFLDGLTDLAISRKTSFMIVHHTAKSAASRPDNIRISPWGSVFTGASLDPAWRLTRQTSADKEDRDHHHIELEYASKEGPESLDPLALIYGKDTSLFEIKVEEASLERKILHQLKIAEETISQAELARRVETSDIQVHRVVSNLEKKGQVITKKMGSAKMVLLPGAKEDTQSEF